MSRAKGMAKDLEAITPRGSGRHLPQRNAEAAGEVGRILAVLDALDSAYGNDEMPPEALSTGEPLDGLILTLLSQNTNDRNRDMAYDALRARYPAWEDVASLTPAEIASLIRPAGLGDTKSVRMRAILEQIRSDFGAYSLSSLKKRPPDDVRRYLSDLPGIGPKTVACVMMFDLGMPAFPVDTHVARVSRRLGWVKEKMVPERIQEFLELVVPPERCGGGHLNMIEHGRAICGARHPKCEGCVVVGLCERVGVSGD
ncbi:MAG: endonuclease III [Synergistaceae bacterium]|nr:endonuclease III [Synergistaceae bacterium]